MSDINKKNRRTARGSSSTTKFGEKELLSNLVHRIGHDIGNPLTSIISLASIIQKFSSFSSSKDKIPALSPDKFSKYATSIIDESWRISSLTEHFVMLLSQKTGAPSDCDIAEVVKRALAKLKTRKHVDSSRVRVIVRTDQAPVAIIDPDQFLVLTAELITNAFVAVDMAGPPSHETEDGQSSAPPPISVLVDRTEDSSVLTVENICPTPCPFELPLVFEPFATAYPEQKHMGLGLAMASAIVARAKGIIEVEEYEVENGYKFITRVMLPHSEQAGASNENPEDSLPEEHAQGEVSASPSKNQSSLPAELKIWMIEDEDMVASAMCKILQISLGKETNLVCHRSCGEEALKEISDGTAFDVMLCDLNLAGISGRHVLDTLLNERPEEVCKFAFLTGEQSRPETKLYLKSSNRPYLLKPFEPEELITLVQSLIEKSRQT